MRVVDLKTMMSGPYKEREMNIIFNLEEFKVRNIKLPADGKIPDCEMQSYVIFYIVEGSVDVTVDQEKATITEGQCLISDPATISMSSKDGAKIMGIQIPVKKGV
jgi:mannose-6-phosphate isomerase-like protein (cupin superfamily)